MIIIDRALQARAAAGNPVKVGMIGAGFMGRGIANQIINSVPGMELVAIFSRQVDAAKRAYTEAGQENMQVVTTVTELEDAIANHKYAVTEDVQLLCQAEGIDAIIEVNKCSRIWRSCSHGGDRSSQTCDYDECRTRRYYWPHPESIRRQSRSHSQRL